MALATEKDPVQTLLDILDATSDSDYTGSKPSDIEKLQAHDRNWKHNRSNEMLFVWRPTEGDMGQSSTESYNETQVVQVEAWSPTSEDKAWEVIRDVRDHIWDNYGYDNGSSTDWHRIQPVAGIDHRAETKQGRNQRWVAAIQVRLTQLREV